ncbi:hypothetical protein DEO72_LG1g1012 [Vigna unguiculata]|uniref:Uncharacterized protein n=1 Tax=Vigna unguiculata TaxID=3917 RepID=A0A4D6KQJ8_VIGUN|nr:hypothetical protein DEO72_LG1g1012 [Vigna unguiculata]
MEPNRRGTPYASSTAPHPTLLHVEQRKGIVKEEKNHLWGGSLEGYTVVLCLDNVAICYWSQRVEFGTKVLFGFEYPQLFTELHVMQL